MGLSELCELRQLREENGKLKRLVAYLSFDRHILQEIVQKSCEAPPAACARAVDSRRLCAEPTPSGGADEHHPQDSGIPQPTTAAGCFMDALARAGDEPGALRLPAADGDLPERGWARESQAHLSALHRGWSHGAHQMRKKLARRSRVPTPRATRPNHKAMATIPTSWALHFTA